MNHNQAATTSTSDPRIVFFDDLAPRWDEVGQNPVATVARLVELSGILHLEPGSDLLEAGCGTGQISGWLAQQVAPGRLLAIDFAEAMLEQARNKVSTAEFRCADVCRDDLGMACFDTALCFHSFPHFRDQAAAIATLARALRPGGRLIVMHLAGSREINSFHDHVGGAVHGDHLPSSEDWASLLGQVGLELQQLIDQADLYLMAASKVAP